MANKKKIEKREKERQTHQTERTIRMVGIGAVVDDTDKPYVSQMSNQAKSYFNRRFKELKTAAEEKAQKLAELEKTPKESFYNHPEAYKLTPEYSTASSEAQVYDFEANFWKQQLINVKEGKPWQSITGYDKDGQPQLSELYKPTPRAEADILGVINEVQSLRTLANDKLSKITQEFSKGFELQMLS